MLGVTEQDKGLFFLARVRTLLKRKDVYVGQLKKEIINCLNIETILPSMQQITLISSVLSLFLSPSPLSLLIEGFLSPVDSKVRTFS